MNLLQPPTFPRSTSPKGHETVSIGVLLEFTISQVVQKAENCVVSIVVGLWYVLYKLNTYTGTCSIIFIWIIQSILSSFWMSIFLESLIHRIKQKKLPSFPGFRECFTPGLSPGIQEFLQGLSTSILAENWWPMVTFVAGSLVVDSLAHQKKILRKQLVLSWSLKAVFFGVLTRRDALGEKRMGMVSFFGSNGC